MERVEKLQKAGKLNEAKETRLHALIAKVHLKSEKSERPDVIAEAARFDAFLNANPQIVAELEKNPSMIDNKGFMAKNPALTAWLKDHPNVAQELRSDPAALLKAAIDLHTLASLPAFKGLSSAGISMGELARFDLFLTSHPAIAKELKSNPSLISDAGFTKANPALATWLTAHPDVAKESFLKLSVDLYAQCALIWLPTSLVHPESFEGIHRDRAPRRDVACQESYRDQESSHHQERERIACFDPV